ncbi:MAG: archease [Nitrospirae bacterium]|nr:archease [Nitrospirota bacterium]
MADKKRYETLDIFGDVGLRVFGNTLNELFENAALGMSGLITDTEQIRETEKKQIAVEADNYESLFVRWLNELVFLFDTHGFIGKQFSVSLNGNAVEAEVSGGYFDPEIHEQRLLIKAATYHRLFLKKNDSGWLAEVIFDI